MDQNKDMEEELGSKQGHGRRTLPPSDLLSTLLKTAERLNWRRISQIDQKAEGRGKEENLWKMVTELSFAKDEVAVTLSK